MQKYRLELHVALGGSSDLELVIYDGSRENGHGKCYLKHLQVDDKGLLISDMQC